MVVGLTTNRPVVAVRLPGVRTYVPPVPAPLAVRVVLVPLQMVALVGARVAVTAGLTVTVADAVAEQPWADVTVTEYGLAPTVVGVTTKMPVVLVVPSLKRYVLPPVAVRVALVPAQIVALPSVAVTAGLMVTMPVATAEQPWAEVTVTEYGLAPLVVGLTTTTPVVLVVPSLKRYVLPPVAVSVAEVPLQIVALPSVAVTAGLTVIVADATAEQPWAEVTVTE